MPLHVLALEPFYGGSHRSFLDGLAARSRHRFHLLTLPARKWKWRMRGGALTLAEEARTLAGSFDVIFASDFLNLAEFRALAPAAVARLPAVVYFHENQLTYPVREPHERDYQFAFTNLTTALAANEVWFNSAYHRQDFLNAAGPFLRRLPQPRPREAVARIEARSRVVYLGVDLSRWDRARAGDRSGPARILWNQRWEFDKNPEDLFEALTALRQTGADFRLSIVGERYRDVPDVFITARAALSEHIDHWGFLDSAGAYGEVLKSADVVVSTALHEFFGISIVEAICAGAYPLLPKRLTYPELLPPQAHKHHLYTTAHQLVKRMQWCCEHVERLREGSRRDAAGLQQWVSKFDWGHRIAEYDEGLERVARGGGTISGP